MAEDQPDQVMLNAVKISKDTNRKLKIYLAVADEETRNGTIDAALNAYLDEKGVTYTVPSGR